jgi:hypothetical protein
MWWAALLNTILGAFSSWVAASTSSYESIASITASGGETSLTLSSIPSTYKHLQIRMMFRTNTADTFDGNFGLQLNNDTGSNYTTHLLNGFGASASASGGTGFSSMGLFPRIPTTSQTSGVFNVGIIDIQDYQSTSKYKTVRAFGGTDLNGDSNYGITLSSGLWLSTSAVNSVKLYLSGNQIGAGSTFALYGIKG